MIDALAAAEAGMMNDVQRLHVISHNLANSSTAGFRKEIAVTRPFVDFMSSRMPGAGTLQVTRPQLETRTDYASGTLKFTGNVLDVALENDGFFEVAGEQGTFYTRQGDFRVAADGRLTTVGGLSVLGRSGEIRIRSEQPVIDQNGKVWEGGNAVGQLRVVRITNPESLLNTGSGLLIATESTVVEDAGSDRVRQGYLETANVGLMDEMIRLIETMRHFESSQRVISGYDEMLDKAINVIGDV